MRALLIGTVALALVGCQGQKPAEVKVDKAKEAFDAIAAIPLPVMSASTDVKFYQAKYEQAWQERTPLVHKVLKDFPDDPRSAKVADEYWQSLMRVEITNEECDKIVADISEVRKNSTNAEMRQHAAFWSTFYSCYRNREEIDKVLEFAEGFSNEYPNDPRGSTMFSFASMSGKASLAQMKAAFQALIAKYPNTEDGGFARAMLPLLDNVGKTFEFDFKDAVTGKRFTDESFRGKILVVDWWATWCVPCIQSLPKMKELSAKYKSKGVEFIGVSLDRPEAEGGLKNLLEFVNKNAMSWPQYYLNGDATFQTRYKVAQIPTVFVVDKSGKIVSIDGYRTLERTLEEMAGKA